MKRAYHYTNKPFPTWDITKCENGFFVTDLPPTTDLEILEREVGAGSYDYVAIVEFDDEADEAWGGYNIHEQTLDEFLNEQDAKYVRFGWDNGEISFNDYATTDPNFFKIVEWVKL